MSDELTLDVKKLKEAHELKEGASYILEGENLSAQEVSEIKHGLYDIFRIKCMVITTPIKLYEVKKNGE